MTASPPSPAPRRSRGRTVLRWTARVLVAVVVLVLVGAGAVYGLSERRFRARITPPSHALTVRDDAATVARGKYLASTRGCAECHGENLAGTTMIDDPMFGRLVSSNLTRGGRGGTMSDRDWELAVRHGLRADGSGLVLMPSQEFNGMSDEDLAAIVAYARSVAPAAHVAPPPKLGPVPRVMVVAGVMPLLPAEVVKHDAEHRRSVVAAPTAEYGEYLAVGCTGCHGQGFSGGPAPGGPPGMKPAANITPGGIGAWSEADFVAALRTGRRPDGSAIDAAAMPIKMTSQMHDVELKAIYAYLRTVPAKPYGNR